MIEGRKKEVKEKEKMKEGRQGMNKYRRKVEDGEERKDSSMWGNSGQSVRGAVGKGYNETLEIKRGPGFLIIILKRLDSVAALHVSCRPRI